VNGVYWIHGPNPQIPVGAASSSALKPIPLAIVLCPHGGRHLARELAFYKRAGVGTLVSLLTDEQMEMFELTEEPAVARQLGMKFLHHPLPDHEVPTDVAGFRRFVAHLADQLGSGEPIGVHCLGSIGRAPMTAACTLIHLGWRPQQALTAIELARGCQVPDTEEQQRWILDYKASP
jgi:protein-tyrosine phosphatase